MRNKPANHAIRGDRDGRTLPDANLVVTNFFAMPLPIVLHHGFAAYGDFALGPLKLSYFRGIDRAIRDAGHELITTRVHPTGSIELRARQLKEQILRSLKSIDAEKGRFVLIGHSMGGLDARYMISRLGMDDQVAACLTITCPHRGSP